MTSHQERLGAPKPLNTERPNRPLRVGPFPGTRLTVAILALATMVACGSSNGSTNGSVAEAPPVTDAGEIAPNQSRTQAERAIPERGSPEPGTAWVIFGTDTVIAEVASTPAERSQGLMDREEIPEDTGMLFVFPNSEIRSFWMKNTFVALDIAFLDDSFTVVDIKQLEPENETPVDAEAASTFALEVIQGWFATHGVSVGDKATIIFGPGLRVS